MSLSEGNFKAKATALSMKKASTGNKFVAVTFRLVDGPDAGKTINWQGYLTKGTQERTIKALNAMGFDGEKLESCTREVLVVIENEEYVTEAGEKQIRARVKWVNDPNWSGGFGEELNKGEEASMMNELRGLHLSAKAEPKNTGAEFPYGQNADPQDDIKF